MTEQKEKLPEYAVQLSAFHDAFEVELQGILNALPLKPDMKVLDFACGGGFYTQRIAERLGPDGSVVGVDFNLPYLKEAEKKAVRESKGRNISFVASAFDQLPFADESFDFVWCAQSFFSLPDPINALGQMRRILRPGGTVAILENDSLHQILLPWPARLELPLRTAELRAFTDETANASKFYVGRRLPALLAAAGFEPTTITTQAIDRQAPLGPSESFFLLSYLEGVAKQVSPYLETSLLEELKKLIDSNASTYLLRDPYFTMTWLNVLALGKK